MLIAAAAAATMANVNTRHSRPATLIYASYAMITLRC